MIEKKLNLSTKRTKLLRKIINLKEQKNSKLQQIRMNIKQLERTNLSLTGFSKLTKNSIGLIQKNRKKTILSAKSILKDLEEISKEQTSLETQFLQLSLKTQ